ncbi:MAG: type I-E CRISPR-associated protein Cse2/CasB [Oscillospiraceae bacterium]|nr:type I-E CRISPR-associated protein Cse2/CasB [Oscillospiraceae bacterium]
MENQRNDRYVGSFVGRKIAMLDRESPSSQAMLAKLRRGIGKHPGASPEVWEVTLADLRDDWYAGNGEPGYAEYAIHTALTLYAFHRQGKQESMSESGKDADGNYKGCSFGAAIAKLIRTDENRLSAVKRRFDAVLTAANLTELSHHARGIVGLLKADGIKMDYPQFANDLYFCQMRDRKDSVRLRWGEDFYRVLNSKRKESTDNE